MVAARATETSRPEGEWGDRFVHWMRDLGFFNKPGEPTLAARNVADLVKGPPPKP